MNSTHPAPWWRQKSWWIDHWADVTGAIVVPLLLYMIDCNGKNADTVLVHKQIDVQQQSKNESAAEADNHQAISLLEDLSMRVGDAQLPQRRAIAQAVVEYSMQGRLYHPSTSVVIDYLGRECDDATHDLLRQASNTALIQTPKNAIIPTCEEKSIDGESKQSCLKRKTDALASVKSDNDADSQKLAAAEQARKTTCTAGRAPASIESAPAAVPLLGAGPRVFRQYVDVGCGETHAGTLYIPLSSTEAKTLQITGQPTAHFEGVSNLNSETVNATQASGDAITVEYSISGLDRQFLGNCPGGGHATVVVEYQLAASDSANQTQQTPQRQP